MRKIIVILAVVALAGATACTRTQKGGVIGAGTGAALGGLIGKSLLVLC